MKSDLALRLMTDLGRNSALDNLVGLTICHPLWRSKHLLVSNECQMLQGCIAPLGSEHSTDICGCLKQATSDIKTKQTE